MNWTMGRYIDEATDEMRDRLVTAEDFLAGADWWDGRCGCLVGTATAGEHDADPGVRVVWDYVARHQTWPHALRDIPAYLRFPRAVRRFGKARVVRAIKLRAGSRLPATSETRPEHAVGAL